MRGIVPGRTVGRRVHHLRAQLRGERRDAPPRDYLSHTAGAVRRVLGGQITYAALPFERVDWDQFDIIGVNHYWHPGIADRYVPMLQPWLELGKPMVISELGFRTCTGAEAAGPAGSLNIAGPGMVAHQIPVLGSWVRPRVEAIHERNEELQAALLLRQLELLDQAGVNGAFVFTFSFPLMAHDDDPRHDLDADSFALVKTLPSRRRGTSYPDLTWEPKQSFRALAGYFGGDRG